ncbi:MAG: transaldolase [Armatimonadetes bacterium]|jgi:transaldolase|nr:transaldolase [Armatimonadota bacterium]
MATMEVPASAVERLAATGSEIWWDSSPLIFAAWLEEMVGKACCESRKALLRAQLEKMYRFDDPAASLLRGITTNPPLSGAVVKGDPAGWDRWTENYIKEHPGVTTRELFWETYKEVVRRGAEMFRPIFEATGYREGYLSGQVDPRILQDTDAMVAQGVELNTMARNVMVKMPGTKEGIEGIRRLTAKGIPTNATLTFTVGQLVGVAEAVKAGLAEARANGVDLSQWRSVVTMMLGRFEDAKPMAQQAEQLGIELSDADKRWAGLAIFKKVYCLYQERGYESKELAASMRLGPVVDGRQHIWHIEKLAGADAVLTIFPNIFEGWILSYADRPIEKQIDEEVPAEVLEKLLKIPYFRDAYDEHGIAPEEFINHPAVVETATAFNAATDELEAYAAQRIAAVRG